jgi:P27 family predicted phage terminase small subunit
VGIKPPKSIKTLKHDNDRQKRSKKDVAFRERAEPSPKTNELKRPAYLSPDEAVEWDRITELYKQFDDPLISDLDGDSLAIYCQSLVLYKMAIQKVKDTAAVYKSPKDQEPKINPWLKVANDASDKMFRYSSVLLLDPMSRARMGLARVKAEEENPMASFLKARGS